MSVDPHRPSLELTPPGPRAAAARDLPAGVKVLGIDPGLQCTGLVVVRGDDSVAFNEAVQPKTDHPLMVRLKTIVDRVLMVTAAYQPAMIVLEAPAYGKRGGAYQLDLAAVRHVVCWELFKNRLSVVMPKPNTVKKVAGGKGNLKKDKMALAIFKRFGVELPTSDETDAYACAQYGLAQLRAANQNPDTGGNEQ